MPSRFSTLIVFVVLLLAGSSTAYAQQGTITGTVVEEETGEPLPAVNVGIVDTPLGAATGNDGQFTITDVPVGTYTVRASLVGYSTTERSLRVETSETTTLQIQLSKESVELSEIRVTGRRGGYVASDVSSVTKIGAPLSETPQSVSVITRDQLAARGLDRLSEALRYTPGTQGETFGFEPRTFFLRFRGFDATTSGLYRNGLQLRNPSFAVGYSPEPYGAERVEVPRGPASVLYGAGSLGGLVNFISKRPTQQPFGEVVVEPGTYNRWQGQLDLSGPIGTDGTFSYRLTGLVREADTQVDNIPNDRIFVAPAFSWQPTDATKLTLLGRYQNDETRPSQRLPVSGTLESNPNGTIPVNRYLGEPGVDQYDREQWSAGYLFQHTFNDTWRVDQKLRYYSVDVDDVTVFGSAAGLANDERTLSRSLFESFGDLDGLAIDNQLQANLTTGPADHTFLLGADIQRITVGSKQNFGSAPSIDVFDPTYGQAIADPAPFADNDITQRQIGVYLQEQATLYDRLIFTLNGRMDWARTETVMNLSDSEMEQSDRKFSGRAGLVYTSQIGLNPYASYSQSFLPQLGTDANGEPFDPALGEQWEVGAKYQPPGRNSFLTVALFDLTRQNFLQVDPQSFQQVQTGEANSQGIEVEGVASLGVGLDLTLSYTRQAVEITESVVAAEEGERPVQVREQMGSFWADYTLQEGPLQGLGVGGGVRYLGPSFGDVPNTLEAPSVTLVDATVHYDWNGVRFQVNADNVFDNEYVASTFVSGAQDYATYGAARTITARLRYRW
ncbi:TonB-dependent siderophore receptor [Longibacter salinarum]|uniref:TonB-dependent siderophore receptor n=1 Tax=Longibacter salinarum TaxID=1850348 RepID=A0A2A8CU92_9BACT|nr:TonB-dependent siderophore receptor [Longibacter salinarum]PEN11317.1 TonB-dependent siderophore receptor [Longibacter salinarum]